MAGVAVSGRSAPPPPAPHRTKLAMHASPPPPPPPGRPPPAPTRGRGRGGEAIRPGRGGGGGGRGGGRHGPARPDQSSTGGAHRPRPPRPRLAALVIVEGASDAAAVSAAVDAPIHALGGATRTRNEDSLAALRARLARAPAAVVLTDPDAAGRAARGDLARALAAAAPGLPVYHAFVPLAAATATAAVRAKAAGDVGIEHVPPPALAAALACAKRARPQPRAGRASPAPAAGPFTPDDLEARGLTAPFNARQPGGGGDGEGASAATTTAGRRAAVCAALGLGPCSGAQLLTALNGWGFELADLDAVLTQLDEVGGTESAC